MCLFRGSDEDGWPRANRVGMAPRLAVAAAVGLIATVAHVRAQDDAPSPPAQRQSAMARAMRAEAEEVVIEVKRGEAREKVGLRGEPAYRFDDPARGFLDGMVWACGRSGRPVALLTVSAEKKAGGERYWLHEMTSLTDGPLTASGRGWRETWEPDGSDLSFVPLPKAPMPAADEARRLRQMKELVRGLKAYELHGPEATRDELRLLTQPILRYADPASGLVDGAIFLLAFGTNPEAALLVEARGGGGTAPTWSIGIARITTAGIHIDLDGQEAWNRSGQVRNSSRGPYWYHLKPMETVGP